MAEEKSGAVQNKLGQLFIDIGANGLGNLVKGLQSLQANFLLSKKAGEEFIKPFKEMSLNASNAVANYDKLHAVMGTSQLDIQNWRKAAERTGTPFNTLSTGLKNFQQQLLGIRAGLDSNGMQGFALLGIDPNSLDYKKPFENLMFIFKRLQGVNEATRTKVISLLGLSEDLIYFVDKYNQLQGTSNRQINENLLLNKQEMGILRDQNDAWNLLKVTATSAQEKFISKQTWINDLLETTLKWANDTHPVLSKMIENFDSWANDPHPIILNLFKSIGWAGEKLLQLMETLGKISGEIKVNMLPDGIDQDSINQLVNSKDPEVRRRWKEVQTGQFGKQPQKQIENKPAQIPNKPVALTYNDLQKRYGIKVEEALPLLPKEAPPSQSSMSYLPRSEQNNINNEKQFTVINNFEQYINGENPQEIADETGRQVSADLTTLYNINQARI